MKTSWILFILACQIDCKLISIQKTVPKIPVVLFICCIQHYLFFTHFRHNNIYFRELQSLTLTQCSSLIIIIVNSDIPRQPKYWWISNNKFELLQQRLASVSQTLFIHVGLVANCMCILSLSLIISAGIVIQLFPEDMLVLATVCCWLLPEASTACRSMSWRTPSRSF